MASKHFSIQGLVCGNCNLALSTQNLALEEQFTPFAAETKGICIELRHLLKCPPIDYIIWWGRTDRTILVLLSAFLFCGPCDARSSSDIHSFDRNDFCSVLCAEQRYDGAVCLAFHHARRWRRGLACNGHL